MQPTQSIEIVDGDHRNIGVIGGEERRGSENEGEQEAGAHGYGGFWPRKAPGPQS
ncbi:MAG: hypothetical protein R2748_12980 [Bryobacterales bacterium]